jgi:LPXTG-site transpeptidase (sortase) family protein
MTDQEPRPGRRDPRRGAILVGVLAVAAIAFGLAISFGGRGGPGGTASSPGSTAVEPGATSAYADLSLVPVLTTTTPDASASPEPAGSTAAPASVQVSTGASPVAGQGIRANRIRIARLDIDLKVVEGDGIDAPIGKAAHYPGSAWPDAGSNIYIYGHAREGMFLTLWEARVGDVVELDLVDGTTRTYVVDRVLPKVPWNAVKYVQPTETEQLTLQTSTSYHPDSPRFIVIAHPAP